jgi:hypothetical protein
MPCCCSFVLCFFCSMLLLPFFLFWIDFPFGFFVGVEGAIQIQVFKVRLGRWEIFQKIFVCWWFLKIICVVFENFWLKMCLFVVCRNYLSIVHLIIHLTFHFYTFHFICTIALSIFFNTFCLIFLFQLLVNV